MKLGDFRKMRLLNLVVCLAFCLNLGLSGNVLASGRVENPSASMLRPEAALGHVEDIAFETLRIINAKGPKELERALADIALSKTTDPLVQTLIENNIIVVKKGEKTFIVCQLDKGWYAELVKEGELIKVPFASEKEKTDFMTDAQRTWISMMGNVTPRQIREAQIAADNYIRQAGSEGRIFIQNNLAEQVEGYAKRKGLNAEAQAALLKRLQAAIDFRTRAIESLTQADIDRFFRGVTSFPVSTKLSDIKKDLSDDLTIRKALIYDEGGKISFDLIGDPVNLEYLAVTASSGNGFAFEGYKGDFPRSIYEILGMSESYMEMVNSGDVNALAAYKAKILLHEYVMVNSGSKALHIENEDITLLVNKYDHRAITGLIERQAQKAKAKIVEEENKKTIAEATSANIGKFLQTGAITPELIDVANAQLQELAASGLLTGYRIVIRDGKICILTTRQNSKAVEDDAKVPSAILDVYLKVLTQAKDKGIYAGWREDLTGKTYRQQVNALELSTSAPTLKYLQPEGWAKTYFGKIRTELRVPEGQAKELFTHDTNIYIIAELFAKPLEQIPDAVVDAVKGRLDQDIAQGKLLSAVVKDFGATEIEIHATHRYGELNAAVQKLILEAMKEGVLKANELGLLRKDINVTSMSLEDLAKALRVKYQPHSITERGAEPVVIAKIIGAGIGAANIKAYHEFFMPGSTPLQKLGFVPEVGNKDKPGVRGFRAIVRRTEDVLKGNFDGPVWEFEKSAACNVKGKYYPSKDESLELLALASQPNDFQITAIYTVEGSTIASTEPIISVVYQPVYGEKGELRTLNPTFICRSQSGADAVGGVASMFYDVNFVPGGPTGENFVATRPVTLNEARKAPKEGTAHVVVYGWQSKGNGVIPKEEGGILDHVAINPEALKYEQKLADWLASIMVTHKDEQPYLAPFAAQARVEPLREEQSPLFTHSPKESEPDAVMNKVEAKVASGEYLSIDDDKADMGGKFGHNFTPEYMLAIDRATAMEAIENGQLSDGNIIGFTDKMRLRRGTTVSIGDDSHVLMLGDKSRNSADSHQLSFLAFTRGYYAAVVNGEKPYGLAQDYQGKEAKAAKANPIFYSHFTPRFFEILKTIMPEDYMGMVDKMEAGWKNWQKTSKETTVLPEPFSGNVSQQGIGSARYLADIAGGERAFGILAGDKMGPAALNRPIREGVYAALATGEFKNGLVIEIWDAKAFDKEGNIPINELPELYSYVEEAIVSLNQSEQNFVKDSYENNGELKGNLTPENKKALAELLKKSGYVPCKRIFLDAQEDKGAIFLYLADSDRFNVKQVWGKIKSGWDIHNFQDYLDKPVLGSSVTKLGILAGGEYIGKDDPVMVGNSKLMEHIFAFLKNNPLIIQGDMNGSHWLAAIPTASQYAVANKESHPILVGLRYTLSEDGKSLANVEDVFGNKAYSRIRQKMFEFDYKFKQAQLGGQIEPYGTNWRTVEASYPLAKLLRALQAPNSPFLVKNKPQAERKSRPIGMLGEMVELFKTATGSLDIPSTPAGWTGADESAQRFLQSALALQSQGMTLKLGDDVLRTAKDSANKKAILISARVLRSDPSLILALQSINEQINQNLGVFGSTANIEANAYKFILIADDPQIKTMKDVQDLFAKITAATNNAVKANNDIFAQILTQEDMYQGSILDGAALIQQLKRMGISQDLLVAFVGFREWTDGLKAQQGISQDALSVYADAKGESQIAFAANALFGAVELIAVPNRQLVSSLAKKLELVQEATSITVESKEINTKITDVIKSYREQVGV